MGAPRLLDKRVINAEQAAQQRQKIVEGISLAKKVDAVRESLGEEQTRLDKFRAETTKRIQQEIDARINERNELIKGNERLKEERIRLQAPLDLKEEWDRVRATRSENETWTSKLINQQVDILAREADSQTLSSDLYKRDTILKSKEILTERTLLGAESKYESASKYLDEAQSKASETLRRASSKERDVLIREEELEVWNQSLKLLKSQLDAHEIDLSNREEALKVRYETFARAEAYIRSKNK